MKLLDKEKIEAFVTKQEKVRIKNSCKARGWKVSEFIRRGIEMMFEKLGE